MLRILMGLLTTAGIGLAGNAASFDCSKAGTSVEKLICSDASLSRLDEQLGQAYAKHLRENAFVEQFRNTQRQWIAQRNRCKDVACLQQVYEGRLQQMASEREFFLREGEGEAICERMVKALNEELFKPGHGRVCGFDILQRIPGVQLPPWKKLDLAKDKELYKRFALAAYVRPEHWKVAFAAPSPQAGQKLDPEGKYPLSEMPSDAYLENEWEWAVAHGYDFYQWDNALPSQDPKDVLLIRIETQNGKNCPVIRTHLFTSDLKKPKTIDGNWFSGGLTFHFDKHSYQLYGPESSEGITRGIDISGIQETKRRVYSPYVCLIDSINKSIQ